MCLPTSFLLWLLNISKSSVVTNVYNPRSWETEAGGSTIQGQP